MNVANISQQRKNLEKNLYTILIFVEKKIVKINSCNEFEVTVAF